MNYNINEAIDKLYKKVIGWGEQLILMLPNILVATIIFFVFYSLGRLVRRLLTNPLHKISHSSTIIELILNGLVFVFAAVGFFIALSILQLDKAVTSLLAGAGIIGLALSFAFQDIAANFVSGVLLAIRRPIKVDDIVETNEYFGTVMNINLRSTIVRTQQGQHVHIPNKDIFSKPIVNYSNEGKRRIDLTCGVSYGEDLEMVRSIAIKAIKTIDYLIDKEEISLFFNEFADSSINFSIQYWIKFQLQPDYQQAQSDGIINIKKAFDENNIVIPYPIRTLDFGIKGGEKLSEQALHLINSNNNQ